MRFASIVFTVAGIWGLVVVTPLFFLVDITGRAYLPPTVHPQFFYGFLTVTIAWQIAFLVIARDPVRFRPLMVACVVEKLGYVVVLAILSAQARIAADDAMAAVPDLLLGLLFIAALAKTPASYTPRH
jgi:hypothetical protein